MKGAIYRQQDGIEGVIYIERDGMKDVIYVVQDGMKWGYIYYINITFPERVIVENIIPRNVIINRVAGPRSSWWKMEKI